MPYGLGVDLGTTFTAAAVAGSSGTGMVALGPDFVVPSVVHVAGDGTVTSGLAAEVAGAREPLRLCYWHKRRLGDPTPLVIGGAPYPPAALLAAQLRDVLAVAARERSAPPDSVVLTCPAVWGPYRRELFDEVPRLAGLTGVTVVTEPEAAAMHYSVERRLGPGETVAVYDLGGGTFDATILRVNRGGMEILGTPEGVEQLGGIDFDDALLSHLDTRLDGAVGALDPEDAEQAGLLAQVRAACVRAKEDLSTEPEVRVRVTLPAGRREVLVTR
ncbi:MAG TPA: Hsp70 family protein, partial [Rugosimonospora sp.]|nr:Hsp70 family protein [Rugosimonospora sp.]